ARRAVAVGPPPLLACLAARHRARVPDRQPPRGRRGGADLPELHGREEALPPYRGVRARGDRGRRRPGGGEQRRRRGRARAAADDRAAASATAAVILTALQSYGLQPGPQLFTESGPLVWTLIASLYVGNTMLLVLNLPLVRVWARLLTIPAYGIYAGVLVFAALGAYAAGGTVVDLVVLTALGLLGV